MRTYWVRIAPVGSEGEAMPEVELTVTEANLLMWQFGREYADFVVLSVRLKPNGSPIPLGAP